MWDEHVDLVKREIGFANCFDCSVAHHPDGEAKDFVAVHLQIGAVLGENAGRLRDIATPARNVEMAVPGAVCTKNSGEEAPLVTGSLDNDRSSAITEQNAGGTIRV